MKMYNFLKYNLLLCCLWISLGSIAQIKAKLSQSKVGLNRNFTLEYELRGNADNFKAPNFKNFEIVGGPNQSSSYSNINGRVSQKISYSYVLKALKEGTLLIPEATAEVNGKTVKSNPVSIQVIKGYRTSKEQEDDAFKDQIQKDIFIVPIIEKQDISIGEAFILQYKLYFDMDIEGISLEDSPAFEGFYSKAIDVNVNAGLKNEKYNGKVYRTTTVLKYLLIPQKFGKIELPQVVLKTTVRSNQRTRDAFGFPSYKKVNVNIKSHASSIHIKDLPRKGRTNGFNGAVGQFKFESSISKNEAQTNDAISLKIKINGTGNLKLFELPALDFPSDFEVYDPKISEKIKEDENGMYGSKSYEYLLIPRYAGEYKLPAIPFSYYDPKKKEYIHLKTPEYQIKVTGEAKESSAIEGGQIQQNSGKSVDLIKNDIQYLDTKVATFNTDPKTLYFNSSLFWIINFLLFCLGLGTWIYTKKSKIIHKNHEEIRNKNASKLAKKYLGEAKEALNQNNRSLFYEAISKAIYKYTSDKLSIKNMDLNQEKLSDLLSKKSVPNQLIEKVKKSLSDCDMARYAPSSNTEMKSLYKEVESSILELDKLL